MNSIDANAQSLVGTREAEVFFRAKRHYIQGSLLISECASFATSLRPGGRWVLREVGFRSILDHGATLAVDDGSHGVASINGHVVMAFGEGDTLKTQRFLVLENADVIPPRVEDSAKVIRDFVTREDRVFSCRFAAVQDNPLDGFFRGVVEVTKRAHAEAFAGARNILFLGLRKWSLDMGEGSALNHGGEHVVSIGSGVSKDDSNLTVSRIVTTFDDGTTHRGAILFSYERD